MEKGMPTPIGQESLRHRLTGDCMVELSFSGRITQKAIKKLGKILSLAKDAYPVDDESTTDSN